MPCCSATQPTWLSRPEDTLYVIMAPSENRWCNLPHKPLHGDLRAVHCCCRSRCVISPLSWYSLWPKATQGWLILGTAAEKTLQPGGIPVPISEPYCTAQGRWPAAPWPAAFPSCEWGRGASRTPERGPGHPPCSGQRLSSFRGEPCAAGARGTATAPRGGDACD